MVVILHGDSKMNTGIIYKIKFGTEQGQQDEKETLRYFIKLERNVKIKDEEYNIFIDTDNMFKSGEENPKAKLLSVNTEFSSEIDLADFLGKKLNFEINLNSYEITSIEYPADEK